MKSYLYLLLLCCLVTGARPLTEASPSGSPVQPPTPQTRTDLSRAKALSKEASLFEQTALTQKTTQEQRHHSLIYSSETQPLPSLAELARDRKTLQRFIGLEALRLELHLDALPSVSQLQALLKAIHLAGFESEITLAVDPIDPNKALQTEQSELLKNLERWLQALGQPKGLSLVAVSLEDSDRYFATWQQAFQSLSQYQPAPRLGLGFSQIRSLLRFQRQQQTQLKSRLPDLYLYQFRRPQAELLQQINRLKQILPAPAKLQIADFAVNVEADEYDQSWAYRFAYFFAKQNNLYPTPARLRDQLSAQALLPGILRPDQSLRPGFWLTHVYFHLNRIDLDEHKLTAALFAPLPNPRQQAVKRDAADFVKHFMNTLYKVNPQDSVLLYTPHKHSKLFYDYLKFQTEESLLNSHFARLKEIEIVDSPIQAADQPQTLQIRNRFVTALGDYRFEQKISFQHKDKGWQVSNLSEPQLSSDFQTYQRIPSTQAIVTDFDKRFQVEWQSYQLAPNQQNQTTQPAPTNQLLWFEIKNPGSQPLDAQPVSLTHQGNHKVYAPEPIFFEFFKRVAGGERIQGLLHFPADSEAQYRFQIAAQPPTREGPRIFSVQPEMLGSHQLKIKIHNPLVERLLLPGISLQIKTPKRLHQLLYVLPQALLPLEQKSYLLDLPAGVSLDQAQLLARGAAFPIIDLEINLDDAFRAEQIGNRLEALHKYTEVLGRFGQQLQSQRRESLIYKVVLLNAELKGERAALAALDSQLKQDPRLNLAALYLDLAELFAERKQPQIAIQMLQRLHQTHPDSFQSWRLLGFLYKQIKHFPEAIAAYQQALKLAPANTNTLISLGDLELERLHFAQASDYYKQALKQIKLPRLYKQLAYAYQRQNKLSQAIQTYQIYLQFVKDPEIYFTIAQLYQQHKQLKQAQAWYLSYTANCRSCKAQVWRELGFIYKQSGQNQLAIAAYTQYLSTSNDRQIQQELGNLYVKQGQNSQALQWLQPLAQACLSCTQLNQQVAYLLKQSGKYRLAIAFYQRALNQQPQTASLWRDLAYTAQQAGFNAVAIQAFERLQHLRQAQATDRLALAGLYRQTGQNNKALPLLQGLWQAQASEQNLQAYLASALAANQSRAVAQVLLKAAQPGSPQSLYLAGRVLREAGYYRQAADYLLLAVGKAPRPIVDYYRQLALAYQQAGQAESAIYWLEQLQKDCYQRQPIRQGLASSASPSSASASSERAAGVWAR